jgi:hypothetical protein
MPLRNAVAVETRAGSYRSAIGKIPDESTAGQRIVSMEADAIVAEAFEQFRFNRTRDRVVQSLVDARPYPSMARGYLSSQQSYPFLQSIHRLDWYQDQIGVDRSAARCQPALHRWRSSADPPFRYATAWP